jgi:antitoxin (DNA-binding transcriptional repressor) of toxin-antitoxin stability system
MAHRRIRFTAPSSAADAGDDPFRIGIGLLRASAGAYLDWFAAGETVDVMRRGQMVAQLNPIPSTASELGIYRDEHPAPRVEPFAGHRCSPGGVKAIHA